VAAPPSGDADDGVQRFIEFAQAAAKAMGKVIKPITSKTQEALGHLFEEHPASGCALRLLRAWYQIGESVENADGSTYDFKHCQRSVDLAYFAEHFSGVCSDIHQQDAPVAITPDDAKVLSRRLGLELGAINRWFPETTPDLKMDWSQYPELAASTLPCVDWIKEWKLEPMERYLAKARKHCPKLTHRPKGISARIQERHNEMARERWNMESKEAYEREQQIRKAAVTDMKLHARLREGWAAEDRSKGRVYVGKQKDAPGNCEQDQDE